MHRINQNYIRFTHYPINLGHPAPIECLSVPVHCAIGSTGDELFRNVITANEDTVLIRPNNFAS